MKQPEKYQSYPGELKQRVVEAILSSNLSLAKAAKQFGITSAGTIGKWVRIYEKEGPQGLYVHHGANRHRTARDDPDTVRQLNAQIKQLEMENAYLKKLHALVLQNHPTQRKPK